MWNYYYTGMIEVAVDENFRKWYWKDPDFQKFLNISDNLEDKIKILFETHYPLQDPPKYLLAYNIKELDYIGLVEIFCNIFSNVFQNSELQVYLDLIDSYVEQFNLSSSIAESFKNTVPVFHKKWLNLKSPNLIQDLNAIALCTVKNYDIDTNFVFDPQKTAVLKNSLTLFK